MTFSIKMRNFDTGPNSIWTQETKKKPTFFGNAAEGDFAFVGK
jgi:hypothetical protein